MSMMWKRYRRNTDEDRRRLERLATTDIGSGIRYFRKLIQEGRISDYQANLLAFSNDPLAIAAGFQSLQFHPGPAFPLDIMEPITEQWNPLNISMMNLINYIWRLHPFGEEILFFTVARLVRWIYEQSSLNEMPAICANELPQAIDACNTFSEALLLNDLRNIDLDSDTITDNATLGCDEWQHRWLFGDQEQEPGLGQLPAHPSMHLIDTVMSLSVLSSFYAARAQGNYLYHDIHLDQNEVPRLIVIHTIHTVLHARNALRQLNLELGDSPSDDRASQILLDQMRQIIRNHIWETAT